MGRGHKHSEETKKKMSEAQKGIRNHNWGKKLTEKTLVKMRAVKRTSEWKKRMSEMKKGKPMPWRQGDKHPNWKGGITSENHKIRNNIENKIWTFSVFAKDGFVCQKTKIKGGKLVAHHIQNFSSHPELRFAIDNGITLSKESHKEFHHIYGVKNNTKEQIEEFLIKIK
jgi:hypothetical protein